MALELIIRGRNEAGSAIAQAEQQIGQLGASTQQQGGIISGVFSTLKTGALALGIGLGTALVGAATAGLSLNNAMEQSSARIQAFTKDSEATADILEMVRDRAAQTPFAFNEMSAAAAGLLPVTKMAGTGLEELLEISEVLAASNPAEGLEGAAFALKEAVSGDFTSVIERFNLPRQRLNELKEQGVPALEAVTIAMKELGLDTDLVTGLANTAQGRWSTFTDTLQNLAAQVTQPIFDVFSQGLASVQGQLDANMPAIQAFAGELATGLGAAMQWVGTVAIPAMIAGWNLISPGVMQAVGAVMQFATGTGQGVALAEGYVTAAMGVIMGIIGIATAFWAENGESIRETTGTVWNQVSEIVTTAIQIVTTVLSAFGGFLADHGDTIVAVLTVAWDLIRGVITTALTIISGVLKTALQLLQGDFEGAWNTIKETVASVMAAIVSLINAAGPMLRAAADVGISAIKSAWESFVSGAASLGRGVIDGIISGVSGGVGALTEAVKRAAQSALDAAKKLLGIASPSKLFAEQVGKPIIEGWAQGMVSQAPLLATATEQLRNVTTSTATTVNVGGITINQSRQPQSTADSVLDTLQRRMALRR